MDCNIELLDEKLVFKFMSSLRLDRCISSNGYAGQTMGPIRLEIYARPRENKSSDMVRMRALRADVAVCRCTVGGRPGWGGEVVGWESGCERFISSDRYIDGAWRSVEQDALGLAGCEWSRRSGLSSVRPPVEDTAWLASTGRARLGVRART